MSRIPTPAAIEAAPEASRPLLEAVKKQLGYCPQHIPQKFDAADVAGALADREARIEALEARIKELESRPGT